MGTIGLDLTGSGGATAESPTAKTEVPGMRFFRPTIDLLEDRTVPANFRVFPGPIVLPASHLQVIVPQSVVSGQAFAVTVEALNANNQIVTGFKGTVQITLAIPDAGATFPARFTFSAADRGVHTFQAKLASIGDEIVEADSGVLAGAADLTVVTPAPPIYAPVYPPFYPWLYPFSNFASFPFSNVVSFPSGATGAATTPAVTTTDPIANISYGQNPFGTAGFSTASGFLGSAGSRNLRVSRL